jgi:tryptophan synthase alpha chain
VTLDSLLADVRKIRGRSEVPIVLMGYLNPILRYGMERFFAAAAGAGADGVILPEVPLEEHDRFSSVLEQNRLAAILLVTPASPAERIRAIDARSTGFLYCVASTGVTGHRGTTPIAEYIGYVRRNASKNALMVGFGISNPADARSSALLADGVIVGSALLRHLSEDGSLRKAVAWVKEFREALDSIPAAVAAPEA